VTPRILVAGIGNIFFRDDGFGPAVAAAILAADAPLPDGVRVVDYGIRGMHLTYDLMEGYDALVLIDAMPGQQAGAITVLEVGPDDLGAGEFDAHGMQPVSVLASFATMGGELPPTYVVGCAAADVSEGMGLSEPVSEAVAGGVAAVTALVSRLVGLTSVGRVTD